MFKRMIRICFTIIMYEFGKLLGRELYYYLTANDEVEAPSDFNEYDHLHLNTVIKNK